MTGRRLRAQHLARGGSGLGALGDQVEDAVHAIERGEEIRLWSNGAPGSEGETAQEVFKVASDPKLPTQFTVVHYPSIYVFCPLPAKAMVERW